MAPYDLSSSWVEGQRCELAAFGYSRDGKRGRKQIEYGLLTEPQGRPIAIRVFAGNTADSAAFAEAVTTVRDKFGLDRIAMVGDRGSLTAARIDQLRGLDGMAWITALRAPAIAALASDDGPLQMSLFDTHNLAEITSPDYPGERLIACRNPALADERARKREDLLSATEAELGKIAAPVTVGRLAGADKIGVKVGEVINKHKVGKHFTLDITDTALTWRRDQPRIDAEAALDGIYVIRTSLDAESLDGPGVVTAYKNLSHVERDFRVIKTDDLDLRPIFHYLPDRVRAHVLLCMLAAYLTWHLRKALAPLPFTDPPTRCPYAATKTSSPTSAPSTGKRSTSPASASTSSPNRPPPNGGPSNSSTPPSPSPWPTSRHHNQASPVQNPAQRPTRRSRSRKFGLTVFKALAGVSTFTAATCTFAVFSLLRGSAAEQPRIGTDSGGYPCSGAPVWPPLADVSSSAARCETRPDGRTGSRAVQPPPGATGLVRRESTEAAHPEAPPRAPARGGAAEVWARCGLFSGASFAPWRP